MFAAGIVTLRRLARRAGAAALPVTQTASCGWGLLPVTHPHLRAPHLAAAAAHATTLGGWWGESSREPPPPFAVVCACLHHPLSAKVLKRLAPGTRRSAASTHAGRREIGRVTSCRWGGTERLARPLFPRFSFSSRLGALPTGRTLRRSADTLLTLPQVSGWSSVRDAPSSLFPTAVSEKSSPPRHHAVKPLPLHSHLPFLWCLFPPHPTPLR